MRLKKILEWLEELSPVTYAEEWDNVGLLVGDDEQEIKRIVIALDASDSVIKQAVELQADLVLTHHPMIFKPVKQINNHSMIGRRILALASNRIAYYAMHTNFDIKGGMAELAAEKLDLKGIGRMTVPKNVTFEKGAQDALPFLSAGGTEQFFLRRGMTGSVYYTMTYADPPDFSYGWAMSHKLGVSYLLGIGAVSHKDDPAEAQLDLIAADLNERLIASGASFDGEAPLVKSKDKKHLRYEGSVVITTKEKDVTYHEAYQIVLACDGYFTTLGIINTDADQKDLTAAVKTMVQKRKLPEKVKLLDLAKRGTSLTEWE